MNERLSGSQGLFEQLETIHRLLSRSGGLDVTIERNVLKIAGARTSAMPKGEAKVQLYAHERPEGRFSRAVSLPDDVDPRKVEAKYRDGVLYVSIAVSAAAQPQRISVQ